MRWGSFSLSLVARLWLKSQWLRHIESRRPPTAELRPFIITGPPRSGTSLLTALLTRKPNVLVANEPAVVADPLLERGRPEVLLRGYVHAIARQALTRGTFPTKADPSDLARPTTDTANRGAIRYDVPVNIDGSRPLCVGVKHPIPFMEFLDDLVTGWPELQVVILVRRPGPTLRSWRETTYGWQPGLDDPKAGFRRRLYALVPKVENRLARRAHLWRILIEQAEEAVREYPRQVLIERYEDLLTRPTEVLARMFAHVRAGRPNEPVDVSDVLPQIRPTYRGFTDEEAAVIEEICGMTDRRVFGTESESTVDKSAPPAPATSEAPSKSLMPDC